MLKVAVLCSARTPGLVHLLTRAARRGRDWDVVCCLTSEETFDDRATVAAAGVPVLSHPMRRFYDDHQVAVGDPALRPAYDAVTRDRLAPYSPDVILLSGYLLVLTAPMLEAFEGRIFNAHHADLFARTAGGGPRYPGLRAVRDAILAGERETRATVHVVTAALDDGPIVARSDPFPVPEIARWALASGSRDVLRSVIWAHQEWMLRSAFGPLFERTLDLVVDGRLPAVVQETAA
jgi:folate-dependent phosphoribosylglycinamide formyltransferase PurN